MVRWLAALTLLAAAGSSSAQALPRVEELDWPILRQHGLNLLLALEREKTVLPASTERALRDLLVREKPADPDEAAAAVQKLLDGQCLAGVTINPESRVKAARGPAAADLRLDRPSVVLIKVHNDAGVTHAVAVAGPQLRQRDQAAGGRWLSAALIAPPPLARTLTGQRLQYVLLRLTAHEAGKREATLRFDVGQGTQDLGFRAEVPILFTVRMP